MWTKLPQMTISGINDTFYAIYLIKFGHQSYFISVQMRAKHAPLNWRHGNYSSVVLFTDETSFVYWTCVYSRRSASACMLQSAWLPSADSAYCRPFMPRVKPDRAPMEATRRQSRPGRHRTTARPPGTTLSQILYLQRFGLSFLFPLSSPRNHEPINHPQIPATQDLRNSTDKNWTFSKFIYTLLFSKLPVTARQTVNKCWLTFGHHLLLLLMSICLIFIITCHICQIQPLRCIYEICHPNYYYYCLTTSVVDYYPPLLGDDDDDCQRLNYSCIPWICAWTWIGA